MAGTRFPTNNVDDTSSTSNQSPPAAQPSFHSAFAIPQSSAV
ncbi:hypothetical protein A2U01_0092894, partial [Trifolium medium]|nr:hypothetical protein [Trifolium medium]